MIVKVKPNKYFNQEWVVFGSFDLVCTGTCNDTNKRSIPPIAINKSKNHGGHYLMSLKTVKILHSYEWTELPIENYVIEQVNSLS